MKCTWVKDLKEDQTWLDMQSGNPQQVQKHFQAQARIQEVSSSVPSYPVQQTRYNSLQARCQLSILESRISEILNSGSLSTRIGRGGGWMWLGIGFGVAGSNIETWKTRCTAQRLYRSWTVTEWVPRSVRISYGPRNLLDSFLEGWVVWKYWALT